MCRRCRRCRRCLQRCRTLTRLTPIDTPHAYKLSELVLRVSECVEAVSEWCRSVSIDTIVSDVSEFRVQRLFEQNNKRVDSVQKCPSVN
jgi:hypothetical protein